MEIKQIQGRVVYIQSDWIFVKSMPEDTPNVWNAKLNRPPWTFGDGEKIKSIKSYLKNALKDLQGDCCAYCGLPFDETSGAQIEHIAPKSRYGKFMFHTTNLVLACSLCNGFERKERRGYSNTVSVLKDNYEECIFNIIHPYLVDPLDHLEFSTDKNWDVFIKPLSLKGQKTISMFKLDGSIQSEARGKSILKRNYKNIPELEKLVQSVLDRDYTRK